MGLRHSTARSFSYAIEGIKTAFKSEPNLRIHTTIALAVLIAGFALNFSPLEWLVLVFTIFYVITLELLNTTLESVVNLVSPEIKREAKIAKDVSAAMVLMASIMAVVVALVLFLPKIIALI
ncbi:MAG: diacylglycerol kinase family protein [Candidatus Woesebacteria bacterium]|jgi:diacylglycerol kinase